ncbi:primosomal protein N' [Candidatus Dependentiae bacterium]
MYIKVRLLKGFQKALTYKVPDEWKHNTDSNTLVGKIVRVPIRNKESSALVLQQLLTLDTKENFTIKAAKSIEPFPKDIHYNGFIKKLSHYYQINSLHFLKRMRGFLDKPLKSSRQELPAQTQALPETKRVTLTQEQQKVVDFLSQKVKMGEYYPTVLHGVTGSGKTEVYKNLIITAIAQNKSVILLLPEVTLAIQFEKIMRNQLPDEILIHTFHSATTVKNKKLAWEHLVKKPEAPLLIIGVHIPVLLPIANLGLIIIDEEHESGYQEKKHPKINSKDAAIMRAHENKIPILMGSATPSLSSLYNVKTKNWHFFQLKKRFSGNFPQIKTVFLGDKKVRRNFWISQKLEDSISDRLAKREQIIIFLNRRGYSFFVQCKSCSFIPTCPNCSVSLTLHKNNTLHCHYCQYAIEQPKVCPDCKKKEFLKKGIGTQQVVTILEKIFPYARIGRADLDTTTKKKLWQETMSDFEAGCIDILVGTQTISKGFHFPRVTLVGVLWADLNLHFPIFNATETTLQQLIQVAGRAGRNHEKSEVIVQAMDIHKVFDYLNEIDYLKFYANEIENRKLLGYPPYKRLVEIELKNTNESHIEKESQILVITLSQVCKKNNLAIDVLGPAQPPVSKIKNTYIRKIYLKGTNTKLIGALFASIDTSRYSSRIFFTPNPLN